MRRHVPGWFASSAICECCSECIVQEVIAKMDGFRNVFQRRGIRWWRLKKLTYLLSLWGNDKFAKKKIGCNNMRDQVELPVPWA